MEKALADRHATGGERTAALIGRARELAAARAALADPGTRVVIAIGEPGVGKTALMERVLAEAAAAGAITGACAHAAGDGASDIGPLMRALEQAVTHGLDQLFEPEAGVLSLSAALGPLCGVISAAGDGVLGRLGKGQIVSTSAAAAEERFYQAVSIVVEWLTGIGPPVVLMFDDWGRAGERAANIYQRLAADPRFSSVTLLATERADEPIGLDRRASALRLDLDSLAEEDAAALAQALLETGDAAAARQALQMVGASRRPLDIIYALRALQSGAGLKVAEGVLQYDAAAAAVLLGDSAIEAAIQHVCTSEPGAQPLLNMLAVYGAEAHLADLALILDGAADARAVHALQRAGLATLNGAFVTIAHDKVAENVRSHMSDVERRARAAKIAEVLRARSAAGGIDNARQSIMLWRRLEAGLDNADPSPWAALFAEGAARNRRVGAHEPAAAFAEAAAELNARRKVLSYDVSREAMFAALSRKDFAAAGRRAEQMAETAGSPRERAEALEARVFVARACDDIEGAIAAARTGLGELGVAVPERASWLTVAKAAVRVIAARIESPAEDTEPLEAEELSVRAPMLRAMNAIAPVIFERDLKLSVAFGAGAIEPRVARGSAAGAAIYAFVCSMLGFHRRAGRWAALSDRLQGPDQPLRSTAMQFATGFGHWYVRSRADMRDRAETVLALAYADGDLSLVAQANRDRVYDALMSDAPLGVVIDLADRAIMVGERFDDLTNVLVLRALRQVAASLAGESATPWILQGAHFTAAHRAQLENAPMRDLRRTIATLEQTLAIAFGAYADAGARAARMKTDFDRARSLTQHRTWTFLSGLAQRRMGAAPDIEGMRRLRASARLNPRDNMHRWLLLRAEGARAAGHRLVALRLYAEAVDWARRSGCALEHGVVAQAAGEGAGLLNEPRLQQLYRDESAEVWRAFGATALLRHRGAAPEVAPSAQEQSGRPRAREADLSAAREAAERANAAKSRFIVTVAHELATPLQSMQAMIEPGADGADNVALSDALAQLTVLVRDLTDLGALDGGVFRLSPAPFDPGRMCQALVAQMAPAARRQQRSLQLIAPADASTVLGDEVRIRQILTNLLQNALKHGAGAIELRLAQEDGWLTFVVSDQSANLSAKDIARLFEPFQRGEDATEHGHGLGLSIALRLARAMQGDLTADISHGAAFELKLPLPRCAPQIAGRARDVLLADDDFLTRRAIGAMLRDAGCRVVEAQDGEEALARARTRPFDLVLLDVSMPRRDGVSVARALLDEGAHSQIVMMSAAPVAPVAGLAPALRKPLSREELLHAIGVAPPTSADPPPAIDAREGAAEIARTLAELEAQALAPSAAAVAQTAHRLAGLASLMSFSRLAQAALDLEAAAAAGADLAPRLAEVRLAVGR